MKVIIKDSLKQLVADRYLLIVISVLLLMSLVFAIYIGLSIHSSERQLVSHYSAFGMTHFYFDQWYYLLTFVAFEIIVAVLHSIIAVKLLATKGRSVAIMVAWFGVGIVSMGFVTALTLLDLRTLL